VTTRLNADGKDARGLDEAWAKHEVTSAAFPCQGNGLVCILLAKIHRLVNIPTSSD
jgi:hypothetical protein